MSLRFSTIVTDHEGDLIGLSFDGEVYVYHWGNIHNKNSPKGWEKLSHEEYRKVEVPDEPNEAL